ncbi:MAG: hypothetical protein RR954_06205 [Christensenellaceae bacterium]
MTTAEKAKLIGQATKLTALGYKVDAAREKLRRLVERKMPYDSKEMVKALESFQQMDAEWKELEHEHLTFRNSLK